MINDDDRPSRHWLNPCSVHSKLFVLPSDTTVYPAHDYRGRTSTSMGEEKRLNPRLTKVRHHPILPSWSSSSSSSPPPPPPTSPLLFPCVQSVEEFAKIMAELRLDRPKKIDIAVPRNMICGADP
jgi:sulfur dioxygenase